MEFDFKEKFKVCFKTLNFQESFDTCKQGVTCMTYIIKLQFMIQEKKLKVGNIFWYDSKLLYCRIFNMLFVDSLISMGTKIQGEMDFVKD